MYSFARSDSIELRRVRFHGATDGWRARRLFETAMRDVFISSLNLPPRALLVVKRVAPTLPLRLAGSQGSPAFVRSVQAELEIKIRQAVRPWLVADSARSESVLFADEAELAACLVRDWLRGSLFTYWWARAVLDGRTPPQWWHRELLPRGDLLPPLLSHLAAQGVAVAWLDQLGDADLALATAAITAAHGLITVATGQLTEASPAHPRAALRDVQPAGPEAQFDPGAPAPRAGLAAATAARGRLTALVPEVQAVAASPPRAWLLALALGLQRDPVWVRGPEFHVIRQALETATPAEADQRSAAAGPRPSARRATAPPTAQPPWPPNGHGTGDTRSPAGAAGSGRGEPVDLPTMISGPGRVVRIVAPQGSDQPVWPGTAAEGLPSVVSASAGVTQGGEATRPRPTRAVSWSEPFSETVETAQGGLFYLLNLALALDIYGDFTQPRRPGIALSPWDWLALIGRAWFGPEVECDPVWDLLARLAGRTPGQAPGHGFTPPQDWLVPAAWLVPWGAVETVGVQTRGDRLGLRHPAGFLLADLPRVPGVAALTQARQLLDQWPVLGEVQCVRRPALGGRGAPVVRPARGWNPVPGMVTSRPAWTRRIERRGLLRETRKQPPLARWLGWLLPYLEARLALALGTADLDAVPALVCRHPAWIDVSSTALDIHLSLAGLPIELRIAGLDRDPGWIPAAGRSVAFHFA